MRAPAIAREPSASRDTATLAVYRISVERSRRKCREFPKREEFFEVSRELMLQWEPANAINSYASHLETFHSEPEAL